MQPRLQHLKMYAGHNIIINRPSYTYKREPNMLIVRILHHLHLSKEKNTDLFNWDKTTRSEFRSE